MRLYVDKLDVTAQNYWMELEYETTKRACSDAIKDMLKEYGIGVLDNILTRSELNKVRLRKEKQTLVEE